ncbi:hypothetical protein [Ectobacillus funiculus]|uniref:Uncharacterized protein n=1 Tax=Ectobacillus funiculus TaxID=137993 RepID=A0ABV5WCF7_9BACI
MSYPIIFVHYGNPDWLKYALLQAKEFNSEVILIGDETNNQYPFIKHYHITDYYENAAEFKKVYKRLSRREVEFELFCFERWFIIENFMQKHNLQHCFYQDSDNMLYINVKEYNEKYHKNAPPLACFHATGCSFFINSFKEYQKFCLFFKNHYTDPNLFKELEIENKELQSAQDAGISDMQLFFRFTRQHSSLWNDLLQITNNSFFCCNVVLAQGFETVDDLKKVYFMDGDLYCKHIRMNKFLRCNTLQFQGKSKQYIPYFYKDTLSQLKESSYFDYKTCKWISIEK